MLYTNSILLHMASKIFYLLTYLTSYKQRWPHVLVSQDSVQLTDI